MNIPYDLKNPRKSYKLPSDFKEISGICTLEGLNSLLFVQDEAIQVYRFDMLSRTISEYTKLKKGDSEDIAILGNCGYILTAGKRPRIYQVDNYEESSPRFSRHDLQLDKDYDPEGLCYDAKKHRLLIACKGSPVKDDSKREIFSFDLQQNKRIKSPVFTIDCRDIAGQEDEIFNPSGIAIHPLTNDVYLIGTRGAKMVVRCGWDGAVKGFVRLDEDLFVQPEGIAFTETGELIVCSEGTEGKKGKKSKKARILLFPCLA